MKEKGRGTDYACGIAILGDIGFYREFHDAIFFKGECKLNQHLPALCHGTVVWDNPITYGC